LKKNVEGVNKIEKNGRGSKWFLYVGSK
jgi:hypothetical protein